MISWLSIKDDSEDLNLDAAQNRETDNNLRRSNDTVELRIKETYCWLLVPYIDRAVDMKTVVWDIIRISGGTDTIVSKAAKKMIQNEALITKWAPALLLMLRAGIDTYDDMRLCYDGSEIPDEVDVCLDFEHESIGSLNEMCETIAGLDQGNLIKLAAAVSMAKPKYAMSVARRIAMSFSSLRLYIVSIEKAASSSSVASIRYALAIT